MNTILLVMLLILLDVTLTQCFTFCLFYSWIYLGNFPPRIQLPHSWSLMPNDMAHSMANPTSTDCHLNCLLIFSYYKKCCSDTFIYMLNLLMGGHLKGTSWQPICWYKVFLRLYPSKCWHITSRGLHHFISHLQRVSVPVSLSLTHMC